MLGPGDESLGNADQFGDWGIGLVGQPGQNKVGDRVVYDGDGSDGAAQPIRHAFTGYHHHLSGYEVVTRETSAPDWTQSIPVGNVASVTLDIAKDNLQFGVRAVDNAGHRSPVGFPVTVTT